MSVSSVEEIKFSDELISFIGDWKNQPGNLIMILHRVQEEFSYIPRAAAKKVSEMLNVPMSKIYGVITFYHYFKLEKPGKHNIQVCMGTACYLKGGEDLIDELESILGIGVNQVTNDGKFSIEAVRCVGCCGLAPVVVIGGKVFGKLTKKKLPEVLANFEDK
ncbi:MAG: NAD(P)H-dependent oxidoreductase subunit E [Spirochaetia bacterium]|jgi:NADH-quinone oxidoreductase subunit E|nr:NAD(P)H-dependent oxidoreductase subunit E [Spirochaetia bacterium]